LPSSYISSSLPFVAAYGAALDALGDPTRRAVLELLAGGRKAVGELAQELPVSRPAVSQHLRVLKDAGLVTSEARGTRRLYAVDTAGLEAVRTWVDRFWDEALANFKELVEQEEDG
jgi:DNA-binding transcriptional ArsR family regulator